MTTRKLSHLEVAEMLRAIDHYVVTGSLDDLELCLSDEHGHSHVLYGSDYPSNTTAVCSRCDGRVIDTPRKEKT